MVSGKKIKIIITMLLFATVIATAAVKNIKVNSKEVKLTNGLYAELETTKGTILIELEYKKTPMTVANFTGLAEGKIKNSAKDNGVPYYDGLKFHRVIANFMIQGGDPKGNGTGGPGYNFPDEFDPTLRHDRAGILSMANAGPGTNGSQFFITHTATPHLNDKHTVFGHVVEGQDVVNAIAVGDAIKTFKVIRVGTDAEAFKNDQSAFDSYISAFKEKEKEENVLANKEQLNLIKEKYPNAETTESGLMYVVETDGEGATPEKGTTVTVHYTGTLLDGTTFDSSVKRGKPFQFTVGISQVIQGWDEAFLSMKKGEKRILIIPPELGYGARGAGGIIPPNSWLIFEVELLKF